MASLIDLIYYLLEIALSLDSLEIQSGGGGGIFSFFKHFYVKYYVPPKLGGIHEECHVHHFHFNTPPSHGYKLCLLFFYAIATLFQLYYDV